MIGNVWQWTSDLMGLYDGAATEDPKGPAASFLAAYPDWGRFHPLRGGSWINNANLVRVSFRNYVEVGFRAAYVGFRCAAN
jgi:formylglycine-generating enzyme required for sulfatase activity